MYNLPITAFLFQSPPTNVLHIPPSTGRQRALSLSPEAIGSSIPVDGYSWSVIFPYRLGMFADISPCC